MILRNKNPLYKVITFLIIRRLIQLRYLQIVEAAIGCQRTAISADGLPMGSDYNLTIELISPNGTEKITNTHIVGNLSIIGIVAQNVGAQFTAPSEEDDAETILYQEAISYIDRWNSAEEEFASLLHLAIARPLPTVVTIGGVIDVTYLLDIPHGFTWKGVFMDADMRAIEATPSHSPLTQGGFSSERQKAFMTLSGLQGSILENRIFEDDFQVQSISTAKLLSLSNSGQIPIITIDSSNINTIMPSLSFDENVKEDIINSVNQGLTIRIPNSEITYEDWTGIGYIKENIETGEAGYMLSGIIAGGMTAVTPEAWANQDLKTILSSPYTVKPNLDPNSAVKILKITATDELSGTVGEPLNQGLLVFVLDKNNKPVKGAKVNFKITAGGGNFGIGTGGTPIQTYQATTGSNNLPVGIAKAPFSFGIKTSENPTLYLRAGETNYEQVSYNIIEAWLDNKPEAAVIFTEYGFPKGPHHLIKTHDNIYNEILSFAGFVALKVEDEHGNPIANKPVDFTIHDGKQPANPPCAMPQSPSKAYLLDMNETCLTNIPRWGECGNTNARTKQIISNHQGAAVSVILGGIPYADYEITAQTGSLTETFHAYTTQWCGETKLYIDASYVTDYTGHIINAGKTGAQAPVRARLYYLKNDGTNYMRTDFTTSKATFSGIEGTPKGNGVFEANYTLQNSGINRVDITGTATIDGSPYNANTEIPFYGVDIKIDQPPIILIDENGNAKNNNDITYNISPTDYQPATAFLYIYKENDPFPWWFMASTQNGLGKATIEKGFPFDINSKYEAEIVLNNGTSVEMRSERVPLEILKLYIEKQDPEFPEVKLRWDNYYPALGEKTITVKGIKAGGEPINNEAIRGEVISPASNAAFVNPEVSFTNGKAEFKLSARDIDPGIASKIELKFTYKNAELTATHNVKNNSNTNLNEVLAGEAVFTYDTTFNENHKGKTIDKTDDKRGLDFVQKMINHIIVPLRTPVTEANIKNTIDVDGYYGDMTKQALEAIINGGADPTGSTLVDTKVSHHSNETGSYNTFRKLAKDYSGLEETDIGKVIDKEILVGLNKTDTDKHPVNNADIGIYELYENDDWDGDGVSNYVEVENGIDPLNANPEYISPANATNPNISVERGTYSNGLLNSGLRIANVNKGYYYFKGGDISDTDNYGALRFLQFIEFVAKEWERIHPDSAPLKKNIFANGDNKTNLDNNDDDGDGIQDTNNGTEVRIGIGDLSRQGGGSFQPDHSSHQNGLDMDVRYVRNNNTEGNVDLSGSDGTDLLFDENLTSELINLFIQYGASKIFIDKRTGIPKNLPIVDWDETGGHRHHMHVRFPAINVPTGPINLHANQLSIPANGISTIQITSDQIRDTYGFSLLSGIVIRVTTTRGTIVEGQNIAVNQEGRISFTLRSTTTPGQAVITARSIDGDARGTITINFTSP